MSEHMWKDLPMAACEAVGIDPAKRWAAAERELDSIRAVFDHGANDADWTPGTSLSESLAKVLRERDRARVELDIALTSLADAVKQVLRERDEARKAKLEAEYYRERYEQLHDDQYRLLEAARAVIERWEQPSWKDVEPTGAVIYRLRNVIQEITGEEWQ